MIEVPRNTSNRPSSVFGESYGVMPTCGHSSRPTSILIDCAIFKLAFQTFARSDIGRAKVWPNLPLGLDSIWLSPFAIGNAFNLLGAFIVKVRNCGSVPNPPVFKCWQHSQSPSLQTHTKTRNDKKTHCAASPIAAIVGSLKNTRNEMEILNYH